MIIPPIKSQGIKTKLIPWINDVLLHSGVKMDASWIEPFFGTGAVGFNNPLTGRRIIGDTNPHIINFYSCIQNGVVTAAKMRDYLYQESELLQNAADNGYAHYRLVRDRFNKSHSPFDFIFLSRAGFNGMMRFNKNGDWNIPFCKKPNRFSPAYITKICNQIEAVTRCIKTREWIFNNLDFEEVITSAGPEDVIYCDPPYYGRYVDYYNGWDESDERRLFKALESTHARFILSTWHHNDYRSNPMIDLYWNRFNVLTQEHFYHGGGKIENRHPIVEALIFNFDYVSSNTIPTLEPLLFAI